MHELGHLFGFIRYCLLYCINWKVSPHPKVSPSSKVGPPYNVFLMGKSNIETPFSKVSPGLTIQIIQYAYTCTSALTLSEGLVNGMCNDILEKKDKCMHELGHLFGFIRYCLLY